MSKKLVLAAASLIVSGAVFASSTIAVVDMQKVFKASTSAQKVNTDLTRKLAVKQKKLHQMQVALEAKKTQAKRDAAVMTKSALSKLNATIDLDAKELMTASHAFQQEAFAAQNDAMHQVSVQLHDAVKAVAAKKHVSVVIPKAASLYYGADLDITDLVIKQVNQK